MFKFTRILSTVCIIAMSGGVQASDIYEDLTQDDIWDAIEARDFATVEAIFAKSHKHVLESASDIDHTRWLFGMFGTNSPKIVQFTQDWVSAYPKSAYAHTAQAWIHYRTGWYIRGDGIARELYPDATSDFLSIHRVGWEHATRAYEIAPSLTPASDAIIRLANSTYNQARAYEVLHTVMSDDPNLGTLSRGLDLTNPGWGGSWEIAERMCDHYTPMITNDRISDLAKWCKLKAAGSFHMRSHGDWFRKEIAKGEFPSLKSLHVSHIWARDATRKEAALIYEYLTTPGVTDYKIAHDFDESIARKYGYEYLYETHIRRARENALKHLERDPYNPDYLQVLLKGIDSFSTSEDGSYRISVVEHLPREEKQEYARRMLVSSPYDPKLWRSYGQYKYYQGEPDDLLLNEPMAINTVVYGRHTPDALYSYAFKKWDLLASLERLDTDPELPQWKALSPERKVEAEKSRQRWLDRRETLDMDAQLRCPMMRAYRLHQMICERPGVGYCEIDTQMKDMLELVKADVSDRQACTGIMASPESGLYFEPVYVDLSDSGG